MTMHWKNVSILSVAYEDAPNLITSEELEDRIRPTMERLGVRRNLLVELSGIEERRHYDLDMAFSDMAKPAGEKAIEQAGIHKLQLGVLVNTSVCREFIEPSTACIIHHKLGLHTTCQNFDLGNACLGFVNGIEVVANMIELGQIDYGMVIDAEGTGWGVEQTIKRMQDPGCDEKLFRNNFASLTLGSGAAAMVLARSDLAPNGHRVLCGTSTSATQHCYLCQAQPHEMITDTKGMLIYGITACATTWARGKEELNWTPEHFDEVVIHQVSKIHTENFAHATEIDLSKIYRIYPKHGNIGPAGLPVALGKTVERGRVNKGDRVLLMGAGSGLNSSMLEVEW